MRAFLRIITTLACLLPACALRAQVSTEDSLVTPGGKIYGTLLRPAKPAKGAPVALLIAGSGPTDRNGNNPMAPNNALKALADSLAAGGIATLRYDKRGIGASKTAANEADLRFADYITDAVDWTDRLRKSGHFNRIYIIGHSEGSLIAIIAARRTKVNGVISIAGAGRPVDAVLRQQLKEQLPPGLYDTAVALLAKAKAGEVLTDVPKVLLGIFRPSVLDYLRSWMIYDPAAEAASLSTPLLIIQGSHDIQVKKEEALMLHAARPKAKLEIIPGMNHILRDAPEDLQQNIATYSDAALPLHPGLIPPIVEFMR